MNKGKARALTKSLVRGLLGQGALSSAWAAAVFMFLVLVGSSVVAMAQREAQRVEQRTALLAQEPSPTDLNLRLSDDVWGDEQFPVFWVEAAGSAEPVLPPGMTRLPAPGGAVVSPALDRLAARHPALAARYPDRSVLGVGGVKSDDELLAYIRIPEGRTLSGDVAGDLSGDTPAVRVRAFGSPPSRADASFGLYPFSETLSVSGTVIGVLGFFVLPGLVVLTIGLATTSGACDRRSEDPYMSIEARRRRSTVSVVSKGLIPAVTSLAGVTVTWGLLAPRLGWVPLVGHGVFRGDLRLSWWLLAAELTLSMVATVLLAFIVAAVVAKSRVSRRTTFASLEVVLVIGVALTVFALAVLALYWPVPGSLGALLDIGGVIAAMVSVVVILPGVLRGAGTNISQLSSAPARVTGQELERYPLRTARPFLGCAALVIVALTATGYLSSTSFAEAAPSSSVETRAVFVEWLDPRPDDPDRFADALNEGFVAPFDEGGQAQDHEHMGRHDHQHAHEHGQDNRNGNALVVGATCRQLTPYFSSTECNLGVPYGLPFQTEQKLVEVLAPVVHEPTMKIRLVPAEDVVVGKAFVLDDTPLKVLERRVRDAAMRELPAPHVDSALGGVLHPSPKVAWITGGLVVALVALAFAFFLSLVLHLSDTHERRRHLPNSSLSPRQIAALEAWLFAAPFGAVIVVSVCAGLAVCALRVVIFPDISIPWDGVGLTLGVSVVVGLVGTAGAALLGARSARENLRQEDDVSSTIGD